MVNPQQVMVKKQKKILFIGPVADFRSPNQPWDRLTQAAP